MELDEEIKRIGERVPKDQYIDYVANKDTIEKILKLRNEKNVLILGHNYMHPLVYSLSAPSERGDSLALSMRAAKTDKPIILFDGVRFMAETAKILNPSKKVLIADLNAGCSLADPFQKEDVLVYRKMHPGTPVVTYINSYAEIKAESDYCCTSANALKVVKHATKEFGSNKVIFFPDSYMGKNIQNELDKINEKIEIIYPGKNGGKTGTCEVHDKFTGEAIKEIRKDYSMEKGDPKTAVLSHWECNEEVLRESDFYGSTSEMGAYIKNHPQLKKVYLATECEMSANLSAEFPEIEFVKTCSQFCRHMGRITLGKILNSLENEVYEINVEPETAAKAKKSIDRMLEIGRNE